MSGTMPQADDTFMAEVRETKRIMTQMRRISTIAVNQGRNYFESATVGEVAKAARVPPERVVELFRKFDMWLLAVEEREGMPITEWWVYQDGE